MISFCKTSLSFYLCPVDVFNGGGASKKMKLSKGSQSKDAYMLVYSQRGEGK